MPNCFKCKKRFCTDSGVGMFRLPTDRTRRAFWLQRLRLREEAVNASTLICSDHFPRESFLYSSKKGTLPRKLKRDAVPEVGSPRKRKTGKWRENIDAKRTGEIAVSCDHSYAKSALESSPLLQVDTAPVEGNPPVVVSETPEVSSTRSVYCQWDPADFDCDAFHDAAVQTVPAEIRPSVRAFGNIGTMCSDTSSEEDAGTNRDLRDRSLVVAAEALASLRILRKMTQ
eukprot:m.72750 g.72750  ORF g.72750 m.72750 type:complete len:228 (+) comp35810_c0_seq1:139-822(+)